MAQQLSTYVIKTTLLDEKQFAPLCRSLNNFFTHCEGVQRKGNNLIIRVKLDVWYYHLDEYFDEKKEDGIIGNWTVEKG